MLFDFTALPVVFLFVFIFRKQHFDAIHTPTRDTAYVSYCTLHEIIGHPPPPIAREIEGSPRSFRQCKSTRVSTKLSLSQLRCSFKHKTCLRTYGTVLYYSCLDLIHLTAAVPCVWWRSRLGATMTLKVSAISRVWPALDVLYRGYLDTWYNI